MAPKAEKGQLGISSFFSQPAPSGTTQKRPAVEVLELLDSSDDDAPTSSRLPTGLAKKPKLEETSSILTSSSARAEGGASNAPSTSLGSSSTSLPSSTSSRPVLSAKLSQWRFNSTGTPIGEGEEPTAAQKATREAFSNKLLSLGSRRSAYLQKKHYLAAGAEGGSRGSGEGEGEDEMEEDEDEEEVGVGKGKGKEMSKATKGKGKGKARDMEEDDEEGDEGEATSQFSRFAAKESKAPSSKKATKDTSKGIKYTPLEKQVLALKAEHPGVVLMIEVSDFLY
jgi:DNA mismatch repair protein MSH3